MTCECVSRVPPTPLLVAEVLEEVREYLDDRADVDDGHPNAAMVLLCRVDAAIAAVEKMGEGK